MPTVKGALASSNASWTEAEVLAALASPRSLPTTLPHFVLLQLGTTATELDLGTELGNSPSFTSPPAKLSPARCVYFAKQLVNAGLAFFAELVTTGWLATGKETSSEVEHVIAAINTFRIASRFLLSTHHASASQSSGKQKKLEVETVILRTCSKLRTVGLTDIARAECEYLERLIVSVTSEDTSQHVTFLPPFQHTTNSISEPSPARISFLVDLQSNRVSHALESANSSTLDLILADLNHEYGPLAWQLYGRRHGGEVRVLDRAAFATERSISKALQRLEAPNNQEYLPLRTLALQLLVQVSDIDLTAFWERVARAGGAVLKTAQSQGEDVATAYDAVQDTFETIIATAANVAENSEAKTKLQGEGFQRFCEYWLSFARKAGSSVGIERATAALSGESLSAQSGSADCPIAIHDTGPNTAEVSSSKLVTLRAHLSDTDIAKICAALTGSVLALDNVLAGKSEEGTQAKLDEAARILTQKVAAWPVTGPMSSQLKLYRVLDQLHRRSCSKLSSQGCDSKGQPKADPTGSANVDKLAQACLQLLLSLLAHCEASTTSSSSSEVGAESTPARTASLPSRDACLTDIVYGYRVLANKLFNATSRVARQDAFSELKKCRDIMQTGLAQSLPNNVVAEQLRLLSTSFYNPAGILYNAASYVEAAEFLQLAVDCDDESLQLLQAADSALEQHELNGTLIKRREALNKKLEYTAVAYRFAGSKAEALRTYRRLLFSHARVLGSTLDHHVGSSSIEEVFKMADTKGLSGAIKAVVDLSVYELSLDMDPHDQDHSLVTWLTESNEVQASVKGAILEHCATLVEARSHLSNALLAQERDLAGAQARFAEGLKMAKAPSKSEKSATSSMDRLRQRERQAIAFSTCAHVQLARGDLAASIEATTLALRQLIRLSSNLSHIATRMQISEQDASQNLHSDGLAPSSDIVMESAADQQKQAEEQHLPKFCGSTFSGLFWRCCGLLLDNYTRLSRLHSVRGSAVDAEAMAGEGIDFATSLRFALPLARALVQRGEVRLQLNKAEGGQDDLSRCLEVLQNTWIPEVVSLSYVQGDCLMRIEQLGEALRSYTAGEATLRSLSSAFAEAEQVLASPMPKSGTHQRRISSLTSPGQQLRARLSNGVEMDLVLPELQSRLLQRQAWILHLMGEFEKSEQAVEKAASIRDGLATVDARVEQFVVEGRIALRRALEHLKNDHFFSMLPEAAISIPMVPSVSVRTLVAPAGSHQSISEETVKTAIAMLAPADSAFREALSLGLLSSHSLVLREAFASLAQVHTTQAALGKNVKMAANAAAGLLDWASSVGVRRNLLVAISAKLRGSNMATDDQEWPSITSGDLQSALVSRTQRGRSIEAEDLDEADALPTRLAKLSLNGKADAGATSTPSHPFSAFWQSVRLRHQQAQHEAGAAKHLLPRNWTVISISVRSTDVEHLVLTRQEGGGGPDGCTAKEAVLYSLPMNRRSQRDGTEEEEEQLTLKAAQDKIVEIVRLSNDGIHGVKDVQSMEARRQWWTERHRLDDELRDLLQAMQDTWLGGFKGVFSDPTSDARATAALRAKFEKIIRRACFPTANKRPAKLKLDDAVFECFAGLPVDCTDEDLEDLVHYVMDALQFSGFQVAVDEIDLDETAMDLRGALEEFNGKKSQTSPNKASMAYVAIDEEEQAQDHHIFLVLDKDTAIFPWESMPILRNRAVSRIPSMAFLQDRIELAKVFCQKAEVGQDDQEMDELELSPLQKGKHAARSALRSPTKGSRTTKATSLGSKSQTQVDEPAASAASDSAWQVALRNGKLFSLSQRKTFYLLNPGGDLLQSQDRFEPWLKQRGASQGWKGIVGRQPIVDELPDALSSSDLVLYFGHGGAEQFIRQSKVRELQRCAVAMLWGCSSAMLHDNGEFDRTGTPLNYMCAGAPAMVGNLWDMTDRELDSVCEGVFGRLGLMEAKERAEVKPAARNIKLDRKGNLEATRRPTEMSLARAVAESRNDCRLPYLTGAATVVYGVPVYWNESNL
uniref:separase n=1 Tax=Kalmanozyma brasiliensis (strain GHG001) TaxID=1365824 RepID=V5ESS4_KALBG